jgi:peptidoglycan/xylan/chitin deacetylase (PgdA/CDA1 family)/sulfur carrier protein ThiS
VASVLCVAILVACGPAEPPTPPPVRITVGDAPHELPNGTTFGDVIDQLSLRAHDGRLVSVSGEVLDPTDAPGRILLNGTEASEATRLATGDVIAVMDGPDRKESTRRTVERLRGRHVGNPELTLRRFRIRRVTVQGMVSGEVVWQRDFAIGRGLAPEEVALTFDDGPWPVQTRQVIQILRRFHVPATFFMVGYLTERYPGIVAMVDRAGMRIGNHSWDHPVEPPLADLGRLRLSEEIGRTSRLLSALSIRTRLFRPPGGSYDGGVVQEARRQGLRVVTWSVDPRDWDERTSAHQIVRRVLRAVRPGSIVLMHDGGGNQAATIRALPRIIRGIRRMGLHLVAIPNRA